MSNTSAKTARSQRGSCNNKTGIGGANQGRNKTRESKRPMKNNHEEIHQTRKSLAAPAQVRERLLPCPGVGCPECRSQVVFSASRPKGGAAFERGKRGNDPLERVEAPPKTHGLTSLPNRRKLRPLCPSPSSCIPQGNKGGADGSGENDHELASMAVDEDASQMSTD